MINISEDELNSLLECAEEGLRSLAAAVGGGKDKRLNAALAELTRLSRRIRNPDGCEFCGHPLKMADVDKWHVVRTNCCNTVVQRPPKTTTPDDMTEEEEAA